MEILFFLIPFIIIVLFFSQIKIKINFKKDDYITIFLLNILAISSIITAIFIVKYINYHPTNSTEEKHQVFYILVMYILFFIIYIIGPIYAIYQAFQSRHKNISISIIINSLLATIVIFSSIYYLLFGLNDMEYAHKNNEYIWNTILVTKHKDKYKEAKPTYAFKDKIGIIWTSNIQDILNDKKYKDICNKYNNKFTQKTLEYNDFQILRKVIFFHSNKYHSENVLPMYFECLYYSTVTIATLGNSMTPSSWYMKLVTAIEVLIGLLILVFALSAIGNDNKSSDDE